MKPRHFGKENLCYGQEQCPIPDFKVLSCEGCLANVDEPTPSVIVRGLTSKERDELNQTKARMLYLESQIMELRAKKKDEEITIV